MSSTARISAVWPGHIIYRAAAVIDRTMQTDQDKNSYKYLYRSICGIVITVILIATFSACWFLFIRDHNQTGHLTGYGNKLMMLLMYLVLVTWLFCANGGYRVGVERKMNILASQVTALCLANMLNIFISMAVTGQFRFFLLLLREYFCLSLLQCVLICPLTVQMVNLYRRIFPPLKLLEICGAHANGLAQKINGRADKYSVCASINYQELERHMEYLEQYDAILLNDLPSKSRNAILKQCFKLDKRVYYTPKISDIIVKSADNLNLFDTPLFLNRNRGMTKRQKIQKRIFDVVFSSISLILLSPVMLITALAIHFEDGGPVFFTQDRITTDGKHFRIIKFRSMIEKSEVDGAPLPVGNEDKRITRTGSFIRRTRIDELPQLINILKGEMSVVGPRPERWEHVELYGKMVPEFELRQKVKGGLTGYAQVYGKYNTSALDKIKLDLTYIVNYSFLLDIQIMFETLRVLIQRDSTEGFSGDSISMIHDAVLNHSEEDN